jgi:hypothetical protein
MNRAGPIFDLLFYRHDGLSSRQTQVSRAVNCQTARKSDPLSACKIDPSGAVVCSRPAA